MAPITPKKRRTTGTERFWREIERYLEFWSIARSS
jgi:hypothetical protein